MEDIIDNAFEAELPEVVESEAVDQQAEIPEEETETQEEKRLTEAEWLKKERNVVSRRDKQIAKERTRNAELMAELGKYQQQIKPQPVQSNERPDPNDPKWKNYDEYVDARQDWKLEQAQKALREELNAKDTNSVREYRQNQWEAERDAALDAAGEAYAKEVPNFMALVEQNASTIKAFPIAIKRTIKEMDAQDVVKAFHAMVENDTLEDLSDMSPVQAAAAIVKAASMQRKSTPITRAPAPMASARGTSAGQKTLNRMSPQELVDWVNS